MAIVVGESSSAISRIGFTLGEEAIKVDGPVELDGLMDHYADENLIIVGADVSLAAALAIAEKFRTQKPAIGVILLRKRLDVQTLKDALRAGVREVVPADDAAALLDAATRSRQISAQLGMASQQAGQGKIILVFAAKGGCGKTTIATNLAVAIADQSQAPTCLVDFDLEFGDVAVAMRINPNKTISDVVPLAETLDEQALTSVVVNRNKNLDVLLAPRLPADSDFITTDIAARVLSILAHKYSYVVVDSPPAFTDVILTAFDLAHDYVLLTTLDMPAVKNLQVTLDTLTTLGYDPKKCHIVINRSTTRSGLSPKDVENLIKTPIMTEVPSSSAVSAAINQGKAIIELNPRHEVSKAINSMATNFLTNVEQEHKRFGLKKWLRLR